MRKVTHPVRISAKAMRALDRLRKLWCGTSRTQMIDHAVEFVASYPDPFREFVQGRNGGTRRKKT